MNGIKVTANQLSTKQYPPLESGWDRTALGARAINVPALDILVTGTASDAHTWNLVYVQLVLEELGHRVTNLGAAVPVSLVIEHCLTRRPDLVVVGTINGHGVLDGLALITALRAAGVLRHTQVVIGGKLGIGGPDDREIPPRLLDAGFDAVFIDSSSAGEFPAYLAALPRGRQR